ncbi:MAG: hypothetical protein AAF735_02725 [Myxococcota bacterium]
MSTDAVNANATNRLVATPTSEAAQENAPSTGHPTTSPIQMADLTDFADCVERGHLNCDKFLNRPADPSSGAVSALDQPHVAGARRRA